jgi:hypothetical protein
VIGEIAVAYLALTIGMLVGGWPAWMKEMS